MYIKSANNQKIKNLIKLQKTREQRKQEKIIIEGKENIIKACFAKIKILEIFISTDFSKKNLDQIYKNYPNLKINIIDKKIFSKINYQKNNSGCLAIAEPKYLNLEDIKVETNFLVLILENIEKPGNLGAIVRTARATGVDLIIINDSQVNIYNPNVIYASRGYLFEQKIVFASHSETINWLHKNKIKSFATSAHAKSNYLETSFCDNVAIVMGSEKEGLSEFWQSKADEFIQIPMQNTVQCLNLSVSTAIILFEIQRQKRA